MNLTVYVPRPLEQALQDCANEPTSAPLGTCSACIHLLNGTSDALVERTLAAGPGEVATESMAA